MDRRAVAGAAGRCHIDQFSQNRHCARLRIGQSLDRLNGDSPTLQRALDRIDAPDSEISVAFANRSDGKVHRIARTDPVGGKKFVHGTFVALVDR